MIQTKLMNFDVFYIKIQLHFFKLKCAYLYTSKRNLFYNQRSIKHIGKK